MPAPKNPDRVSLARQKELIAEHRRLTAAIGPKRDRLKQIEAAIKTAMGDATYGTIGRDTVVTWSTATREGVDVKALRLEQPEIAQKFIRTTTVRSFKIEPEA